MAGFCEMLVQSHAIGIHLLPALPDEWSTGSVSGLRARSGFEVNMNWKDGRLTEAVVVSRSGQPCKVVYGRRTWEFKTTAGQSYQVSLTDP